jgi:hypothetical protein
VAARMYQAGLVWLCIDNRPFLSAVGGVVMAFAQQRISAQRIARPGVTALAAGRFERGPCRDYRRPVPSGAGWAKRTGLAALAVRH